MSDSKIFKAAVKLPPARRDAYLDEACGSDQELRREVESLLRAHRTSDSFLESPAGQVVPAAATAEHRQIKEAPGTVIGPYKLMEQIGEGGFGLVFVAEQQHPVRRRVALKIIKPGMDTRDVIARFEAERQALALMEHPNIARVFDAGATDSGRPYFVMELVKGISITDYCDQQQFSPRERLELFVSVCRAVQHAHAKGVIHRDLKPSNILVAPHDGIPVVKVIDFGIAKAIGQRLTDKTIYTRFAQMIGTPLYMSPEQAEINALDVDIRSDVYSLGVLLYELLTGTTPFDSQRLATAAFDELRRIIKEEEPPKPSTRLSSLGKTLPKVSAKRNMEPAKLSAVVKGDLDWIVMKALEKDRRRRYETASAFAKDVNRFLTDEPVEARPPSTAYRLRKFTQRNKGPVLSVSMVLLALLLGMMGTLTGWRRAINHQAELKEALDRQEILLDDYRKELTEKSLMYALAGNIAATNKTADRLKQVKESEGQVLMIRGLADFYAGHMARSRARLERAVDLEPGNVSALAMLGIIEGYAGDFVSADQHRCKALNMPPREDYQDYDEFFLAYLMMYYRPSEAVTRLEKLVVRRPSPLMHAQLAGAIAEEASYSMNPQQAAHAQKAMQKASRHVRIARESGPANYFITFIDFYVHCVTVGLAIAANETGWEHVKDETDRLATEVESTRTGTIGLAVVAWYYEMVDERENAERVLRTLSEEGGSQLWIQCRDFGLGEYCGKSSILADTSLPALDRITGALLAVDDPIQRAFVADNWKKALFEELRDTRFVVQVLQIPLLLGDELVCQTLSKEVLSKQLPSYIRDGIETRFIEPMLMHLAGDLDDEQLLARAVDSHEASRAHLQIALKLLAQGNRNLAQKNFEDSASIFALWVPETLLAKAFSERMKRRSGWPDWIQVPRQRDQ